MTPRRVSSVAQRAAITANSLIYGRHFPNSTEPAHPCGPSRLLQKGFLPLPPCPCGHSHLLQSAPSPLPLACPNRCEVSGEGWRFRLSVKDSSRHSSGIHFLIGLFQFTIFVFILSEFYVKILRLSFHSNFKAHLFPLRDFSRVFSGHARDRGRGATCLKARLQLVNSRGAQNVTCSS